LAVVVDDHLMGISHIIRGEEWISSVPKHIAIYKALGWKPPVFVHTPLLRNPDKSKLSKRKNPVWVSWYKEQGFLPEAIVNYLGLLGYSMPDEREKFSLSEFISEFTLERISKSGPIFDINKLEWLNGEYIRKSQKSKVKSQILRFIGEGYDKKIVEKTVPLIQTRIKKLSDYLPMCGFFFKAPSEYERKVNREWVNKVISKLNKISNWNTDNLYKSMTKLSKELSVSKSKLFMDIRIAVTGKKVGPPLFESMEILGKEKSLKRLKAI
jgi:glutamyl-tRNA synthetase